MGKQTRHRRRDAARGIGTEACRRQGGVEVGVTAHAMGEPNAGAVLWVAIAVTAFGPCVDAPGEVDDDVTLMLRSQRPMSLHDRVGVFEMLIDDAVDHGFPAECAKILRNIACRKQHNVFRLAIQHDPPARLKHMIVWLQRSARVVQQNSRIRPHSSTVECGSVGAPAAR